MNILIKHIETRVNELDESDITDFYKVIDNGKEFTVTLRKYRHGCNLGLAGRKGILYTDHDSDTVCFQVFDIGRDCGLKIESDEQVEGLSTLSIRGVILANKNKETREIEISEATQGIDRDQLVLKIDGKIVESQF